MKQFRSYVYQSSADFTRAMLWEAKYIFRDKAVFFSFLPLSRHFWNVSLVLRSIILTWIFTILWNS